MNPSNAIVAVAIDARSANARHAGLSGDGRRASFVNLVLAPLAQMDRAQDS